MAKRARSALVTNRDNETILTENQSTCSPLGITRRLAFDQLERDLAGFAVEVQSAASLGKDHIVRFEDTSGRVPKA
ncbi:hypothetical protein ACW95L_35405 (plasmid) [Paraburkholderia strydomiana]